MYIYLLGCKITRLLPLKKNNLHNENLILTLSSICSKTVRLLLVSHRFSVSKFDNSVDRINVN